MIFGANNNFIRVEVWHWRLKYDFQQPWNSTEEILFIPFYSLVSRLQTDRKIMSMSINGPCIRSIYVYNYNIDFCTDTSVTIICFAYVDVWLTRFFRRIIVR